MIPHRMTVGVDYLGRLLHIGEFCRWRPAYANGRPKLDNREEDSIWFGRMEKSAEILVGTEYGAEECRTVQRKPEKEQGNANNVKHRRGLLWKMTPEETEVVAAGPPVRMTAASPGVVRSGVAPAVPGTLLLQCLMKATIVAKCGATKNCPWCTMIGGAHTEACRERLEKLYNEEQAEVTRL